MKSIFKRYIERAIGKDLGIFHPYLFAIYPIVAAITRNVSEIRFGQILRPLVLTLFLAILLFTLLSKAVKPVDRAGLLTSLLLLFFCDYGYYYELPNTFNLFGLPINRHLVIILFWVIFISIVTSTRIWSHVRPHIITRYLNILSLIFLIFILKQLIIYTYRYVQDPMHNWQPRLPPITSQSETAKHSELPDIYYIILDGYARQDILQEIYRFDNSAFIDALRKRGFYIASESRSNYNQTLLSLSSSLNLDYLSFLGFAGERSENRKPLETLIHESRLVTFLKDQGYAIISFDSGYFVINDIGADIFLTPYTSKVTNFEVLLLETSAFRIPFELSNRSLPVSGYNMHRTRILYSFKTLGDLAGRTSPKFIFAHIMAPHPPFVFDQNGEPVDLDRPYFSQEGMYSQYSYREYISSYIKELTFLNKMVLESVSNILENSDKKPIIIIQADHGPGSLLYPGQLLELSCAKERTSILNAIFLPDPINLYPSITPVNTFRIIFNTYFNTSLETLPDRAFFATWNKPYDFIDVTETGKLACKTNH
jgi:hypothetical protein